MPVPRTRKIETLARSVWGEAREREREKGGGADQLGAQCDDNNEIYINQFHGIKKISVLLLPLSPLLLVFHHIVKNLLVFTFAIYSKLLSVFEIYVISRFFLQLGMLHSETDSTICSWRQKLTQYTKCQMPFMSFFDGLLGWQSKSKMRRVQLLENRKGLKMEGKNIMTRFTAIIK